MRSRIASAVRTGLVVHLALTVLENLPDSKVMLSRRIPYLQNLPQWRFFAPNPGVENTHVLVRVRSGEHWRRWETLDFSHQLTWAAALWNPHGRIPKAVFDMGQQIRMLNGFGSSFELARYSHAYRILRDIVRDRCEGDRDCNAFQFMIVIRDPADPIDGVTPTLVSESFAIHEGVTRDGGS